MSERDHENALGCIGRSTQDDDELRVLADDR